MKKRLPGQESTRNDSAWAARYLIADPAEILRRIETAAKKEEEKDSGVIASDVNRTIDALGTFRKRWMATAHSRHPALDHLVPFQKLLGAIDDATRFFGEVASSLDYNNPLLEVPRIGRPGRRQDQLLRTQIRVLLDLGLNAQAISKVFDDCRRRVSSAVIHATLRREKRNKAIWFTNTARFELLRSIGILSQGAQEFSSVLHPKMRRGRPKKTR